MNATKFSVNERDTATPLVSPPDLRLPGRQVHLDFHTSPLIAGVGSEFNAEEFADRFAEAKVNSVTVFAKCHHGLSYYPTTVGHIHPGLTRLDLLGEMIEALHRRDIRAPIYFSVAWDEWAAQFRPEWCQLRHDGSVAAMRVVNDRGVLQPGGWKFLCFQHPGYREYLEAQVREVLDMYAVDGLFFDILFLDQGACWNEASVRLREERHLMEIDESTRLRLEVLEVNSFVEHFTSLVRAQVPQASIFYNTSSSFLDSTFGSRSRQKFFTHWEIESLPSGQWGYYHFPRQARQTREWGQPWLGMTGRFQKMWGDFGGIKPQPALEFECFRSQAHGGGNSVGDQLPPRGRLELAAYDLIGAVYAKCEAVESFYEGSNSLPEAAILLPSWPGGDGTAACKSEEGAVLMSEEAHYDCAVLDDADELHRFPVLILPDSVRMSPRLLPKLRAYYEEGGKLILSHRSGFDPDGKWALDFLPFQPVGESRNAPTFWRIDPAFSPENSGTDRVFYEAGMNVRPKTCAEILVDRVLPYFQRTDVSFCSHFHAPPQPKSDDFPAVLAGPQFVYFADPIFREYRQTGNIVVRDLWKCAMRRLVGEPLAGAGLPTTVLCVPRQRGHNLLLTLLHYVPVRKALDIDVIEERMGFAGLDLRLPSSVGVVVEFPTGRALTRISDGLFSLPDVKGRLLLEVPDFFA